MLADSACVSLASKASHSDSTTVNFDTIRFCSVSTSLEESQCDFFAGCNDFLNKIVELIDGNHPNVVRL